MAERKTQDFNPGANRGLDIEQIISAPLVAATTANAMMVKAQAQFLLEFCFAKDGDNYNPVMITMSITNGVIRPGSNGEPDTIERITTTFDLPLLTIIPINSLAVENVSVEFDMDVIAHTSEVDQNSPESTLRSPLQNKGKLIGKIGKSTTTQSTTSKTSSHHSRQVFSQNTSNLKVSVNAGQLPLPGGLTTILDLYQKAISPTSLGHVDANGKGTTSQTTTPGPAQSGSQNTGTSS